MTPQLRACVVLGRFNPAILSPEWVVAHEILPEGSGQATHILGTGVMHFQFSLGGITWHSALTTLEVSANDSSSDPGQFVASVLDLLPHTPVTAIGSNFIFPVDADDGRRIFPLIESR